MPYYECQSKLCGKIFSEIPDHHRRDNPVVCQFCMGPVLKTVKPKVEKKKRVPVNNKYIPDVRGHMNFKGGFA